MPDKTIAQLKAEIAQLHEEKHALQQQLRLEKSIVDQQINDCKKQLSSASSISELDGILASVISTLSLEGGSLEFYDPNNQSLKLICAYPTVSTMEKAKKLYPLTAFPWTWQQLKKGHCIRINDPDVCLANHKTDKHSFNNLQQISTILRSIVFEGDVVGLFNFHTRHRRHHWNADEEHILCSLASPFYSAAKRILEADITADGLFLLQNVLRTTGVGYVVFNKDSDDRHLSFNIAELIDFPPGTTLSREMLKEREIENTRTSLSQWQDTLFEQDLNHSLEAALYDSKQQIKYYKCSPAVIHQDEKGKVQRILVGYTDITEQKQHSENLQWLSDTLRQLHNSPTFETIDKVLGKLLLKTNASGSAVLYKNKVIANKLLDTAIIPTRTPDNHQITPEIIAFKKILCDILETTPSFYFRAHEDAPLPIKNSPAAQRVIEYFKFKSFYCVSLNIPGETPSYMTLDWDCAHTMPDPKMIEAVLFSVGDAIITAIDQIKSRDTLQLNVDSQRWLTNKIERLYRSPYPIDNTINKILMEFCQFMSAERIFIRHQVDKSHCYRLSYEYCLPGIPSIKQTAGEDIFFDSLPKQHVLHTQKKLIINNINDQNIDQQLKDIHVSKNDPIKSTLMLPLFGIQGIPAYMAIDCLSHQQSWTDDQQTIAQSLGDAICMTHARQEINRRLIASEERFSMAMNASKDAMWDWNLSTDELYLSPGYSIILGYNPKIEQTPQKSSFIAQHIHPDDKKRYFDEFKKIKGNETPFNEFRFRFIRKDGATIWCNGKTEYADWDKNGKPSRIVGVLTDITDFIDQEQALNEARELAEQANIAKNDFLARMSHEIRTPMNAIIGLSHLAQSTQLNEQQQDYIDHIYKSSTNLLGIINDILDFSKIEADKIVLENNTFNIHELFSTITTATKLQTNDQETTTKLKLSDNLPQLLKGDRLRLYQILNNLVSNALKFTPQGQIDITVLLLKNSNTSCRLEIHIADTGIGINADYLDHLFEPFTQADGSISRRFGGTGLGLTIVHRLVDLMEGSIDVISKPDQGTKFIVSLPFLKPNKNETALFLSSKDEDYDLKNSLQDLEILIAEDNIVNQKVAEGILKKKGARCTFANNGLEAIQLLEAHPNKYDAILMDIEMPEMDGHQASQHIRQSIDQTTPIIAMTAHAMTGDKEKALASGMNAYLTKPIDPQQLYKTLANYGTGKKQSSFK